MNNLSVNPSIKVNLKKRYWFEIFFKSCCYAAITFLFVIIFVMFSNLISNALSALKKYEIEARVYINSDLIKNKDYSKIYDSALQPFVSNEEDVIILKSLISDSAILDIRRLAEAACSRECEGDLERSSEAYKEAGLYKASNILKLKHQLSYKDNCIKIKLPLNSLSTEYLKGNFNSNNLTKSQISILESLKKSNYIKLNFNYSLFNNSDSRYSEKAGLKVALIGSIFTILICIAVSLPIALITSIYLEEFAPQNKFSNFIELTISNLASVPSIVFGLIGLILFIEFYQFPRSSSIAAGLTLSLIILPIMIFNFRQAIRSVPKSLKENVLALGISKMQVVMHHILPLTFPAILNGIIIAITRAIGETAPLILIGMVAFIINSPKNIFSATTVLPTQIYLWANSPEIAFKNKVSVAILLLVFIIIFLNIIVIFIRKKYEKKL